MGAATVVARGKLSRYQDVNYLLMESFEIVPPPKPADDGRPKDEPPGTKP